ncbi:hypothetical protein [Methylobacterium sp. CM6257]
MSSPIKREMIEAATGANADGRAGRQRALPLSSLLVTLLPKLRAEVPEDAEGVPEAATATEEQP